MWGSRSSASAVLRLRLMPNRSETNCRTTFQYQLAITERVRCPLWRAVAPPHPNHLRTAAWSTPPAAPGQGRGGTTGLLEYQGRRPSLAEGRRPTIPPSADSVGVHGYTGQRGSTRAGRRWHWRRADGQAASSPGNSRCGPSSRMAYHLSRSRGVGARIIRRRKSLTPICHCSRDLKYGVGLNLPSAPPTAPRNF